MTRITRKTLDQMWSRVERQINEEKMHTDNMHDLEDRIRKLEQALRNMEYDIDDNRHEIYRVINDHKATYHATEA